MFYLTRNFFEFICLYRSFYVRTQTQLDASRSTDSYQYFDGLGRQSRSFVSEGSAYIVTDTQYDSMLRVLRTSNPYRTTLRTDPIPANVEWTTSLYDALGRVITVTTPDSAFVSTSYTVNKVLVTDQAGKQRLSQTNSLGQLSDVWEIRSADSATEPVTFQEHAEVVAGYRTSYLYDSVDNLTTVTQGTQTRRFAYDSLKRLIFAANPEQDTSTNPLFTFNAQQWAIKYDYDENSNLKFKTDTRLNASSEFVKVTYIYDALNRVNTRSYNDGTPAVTYKYDGTGVTGGVLYSKGKLTLVSSTVSAYSYDEYDQMGRVKRCTQTTGGQPYQMSYGYDLAGNMTSETYPSGKVIETEYDAAGRIGGVKRQANGMYYAGGPVGSGAMQYAAHGAVASMRLGNGRIERTTFNNRLQPVQIALDSNTFGSNTLQLDYDYGTTTNNGNVLSQTITVPKAASGNLVLTQNYTYDALNRLSTAEELVTTASQWKQTYDYDRWGNRTVRNTSTYIPTPVLTPQSANSTDFSAFNQGNNRIARTGFGYDVAGNLTGDPTTNANAMLYDGENRQTSYTKAGAATNYSYDGDGRRVKKIVGNDTTVFVYNVAGQLIAEYTSGTPAAGDTSYLTTDHLGSTRLVTDSGGNVKARYDYLPFGEEMPPSVGSRSTIIGYGGTDSTKQKFTQKERDNESGLDYFGARYYSSAQGRFTSVDPITVTPPRMVDPQQLNLYGYVRNNPLAYIDPTGMVIDVSRLSEDDLKKWKRIEELANGKDNKGNYVNSKLHEIYDRLQSDKRTFFMENHSFGDNSGTIGETNITKHNGKDDFTEAVIQIDFKKAKSTETTTAADLVAGFNKFEGLLGQGDKGVDARRAEVFGHEGSHGIWDLDNPAEAVKLQMQLADRDAALAALPIKGRYPLPPDVMRKFADADKALVPTERFAQQAEKIVNGELRASIKH